MTIKKKYQIFFAWNAAAWTVMCVFNNIFFLKKKQGLKKVLTKDFE